MPIIVVIIAIWFVLSLPVSVMLGMSFGADAHRELVGMDGDVAVFRRANSTLERMPLGNRAAAPPLRS